MEALPVASGMMLAVARGAMMLAVGRAALLVADRTALPAAGAVALLELASLIDQKAALELPHSTSYS